MCAESRRGLVERESRSPNDVPREQELCRRDVVWAPALARYMPAPAPSAVPPTNFIPTPAVPSPTPRTPKANIPLTLGMTAFILPPAIPQVVLNGVAYVFFLGEWRSLTGDSKDLDKLNQFTDEADMMDKIEDEFGAKVSF